MMCYEICLGPSIVHRYSTFLVVHGNKYQLDPEKMIE